MLSQAQSVEMDKKTENATQCRPPARPGVLDQWRRVPRLDMSLIRKPDGRLVFRENFLSQGDLWVQMFRKRPQCLQGSRWWHVSETIRAQAAASRVWLDVANVEVGFDEAEMNMKREALCHLARTFGAMCWGRQRDECPYQNPPEELFRSPSESQLWKGYLHLRKFAAVIVKNKDRVNLEKMHWALRDALLLKTFLAEAPLNKVRKFEGFWFILVLWHACHIWGLSSSASCEGVGSTARWLEKRKHGGRAWSTGHLVRATMLRYQGVVLLQL